MNSSTPRRATLLNSCRIWLSAFLIGASTISCGVQQPLGLNDDSANVAGGGPTEIGATIQVRPGITYIVEDLRIGDQTLCSNSSNFRSPNGYYLFVTLAIVTEDLFADTYRYFDESEFAMVSRSGLLEPLRTSVDNQVNLGCLDLDADALDHELRPNARQVGRFVVDTYSPTGVLTLRTSEASYDFNYPAQRSADLVPTTGGYSEDVPAPAPGSLPESPNAITSPCDITNRSEVENALGRILSEDPKKSIVDTSTSRACTWTFDSANFELIAATVSCSAIDLRQLGIELKSVDIGIPGTLSSVPPLPFTLYLPLPDGCLLSVGGTSASEEATIALSKLLYERY
jgi:hypothetical protein